MPQPPTTPTAPLACSIFDSFLRTSGGRERPVWHVKSGGALVLLAALVGGVGGAVRAQDASPAVPGSATAPITLHYNTRYPYEYAQDGVVQGLVASRIEQAFKKAGVAFVWAETPVVRQFMTVKDNKGAHCLAGRFKNEDRAQWARFSRPVYRDQPQGLMVKNSNEKMKAFKSIMAAIQSPDVQLLVKAGYTYGTTLDAVITQRSTPPQRTTDESINMLRQIQLGMADAFVIAADEAAALLARADLHTREFVFLPFRDAPQGELRHIMCSHQVPPAVMDKLNRAITFKDR